MRVDDRRATPRRTRDPFATAASLIRIAVFRDVSRVVVALIRDVKWVSLTTISKPSTPPLVYPRATFIARAGTHRTPNLRLCIFFAHEYPTYHPHFDTLTHFTAAKSASLCRQRAGSDQLYPLVLILITISPALRPKGGKRKTIKTFSAERAGEIGHTVIIFRYYCFLSLDQMVTKINILFFSSLLQKKKKGDESDFFDILFKYHKRLQLAALYWFRCFFGMESMTFVDMTR